MDQNIQFHTKSIKKEQVSKNISNEYIKSLFLMPFNDLIYQAQQVHRSNFDANKVQLSTLLSIKTGGCSEDCAYCPQSARYNTDVENEKILALDKVISAAKAAKESGASRFCMGAAWRSPKQKDLDLVKEMIVEVKKLGLESCATLGMLNQDQTRQLKEVGLDYYNHNLDTSPEFYGDIISTRTYQDRLDTLQNVRDQGIHVCCGGIVGMGENLDERVGLLAELANLTPQPESVPINLLTQVEGTPLFGIDELDHFDFVKTIAAARILMPKSFVRLSAGREKMNEATQALAFLAGANSIFYGEELLTTENPTSEKDQELMKKLGITAI
ncbi:MAG: biotin synthase BioB [Proteobacteria bacterium]|jgi:biotin synthase|nr:biotin synthase BioB [Pseudomonadota bacterium]MDA0941591.1 biotin synthase BioB [Pseudomonadota bacterium]MDA1034425.1 biotin synthase BioB [Pseudomonadota bacterium]